jgi:HTH-type transcriptional regulator/antitoxin HigA
MPPPTYQDLLVEILPQVIETERQYKQFGERFGDLVGRPGRRTAAEERLMRLLLLLVQDFDTRHALPPDDSTPAEILQFLLDHSGKRPVDLVTIFGQRSHVSEALSGKRPISAAQARKLGTMFHMKPGLFQ